MGKTQMKQLSRPNVGAIPNTHLVIDLPNSEILRVVSRSLFFAAVIFTLPCIVSILRVTSRQNVGEIELGAGPGTISFEFMDILFRDFGREGLVKKGDKALIVGSEIGGVSANFQFLNDNEIDFAIVSDTESQSLIHDGTFDFVLLSGSSDVKFVDRVLKVEGVLAIQLKDDPVHVLEEPLNFRAVYIRRYVSTIVAMRKIALSNDVAISSTKRKLCNVGRKARQAALKGLENPLLEPPRRALGESTSYLKNIKYLPELMDDTLEGYSRRAFIAVGSTIDDNSATVEWFYQNYPTRNQKFEVYYLLSSSNGYISVSDWLRKNVEEGDYVVMKAKAEIVEEMIKGGSIHLVDELFFECKNQWGLGQENKGERAYWECLSLYGRVRDEGVAIHQWWR
ncbi:uncharacterized protein LOC116193930 [Punica granatum]|uniref:DUF7870 domain-containing protein n=2 Tax=Punica granatum TaxID=22663 RepID=A0A218VTL6_PUNGR|nr:uncharacterized protein LOC116193930 [Punica granatum]OWM63629.1 hypothetical protein CDL15_Pgr008172 [Punica granatum]PKI47193.1 hypothetical protein CRG98_032415 [Punica granatum]